MDTNEKDWWNTRKTEVLDGIKQARELGTTDQEILDIMEELLKVAKCSTSLTEYYNDFTNGDK